MEMLKTIKIEDLLNVIRVMDIASMCKAMSKTDKPRSVRYKKAEELFQGIAEEILEEGRNGKGTC